MINTAQREDILDFLIIGAGVSGIGFACHLVRDRPQSNFLMLEARSEIGGTWDLFRYPGIRSDSDLYTFSYEFKPWQSANVIAPAGEIMSYLHETVSEYDLEDRICFGSRVVSAHWDTDEAVWTISVEVANEFERRVYKAKWLFSATGYYDYESGYRPDMPGEQEFQGPIIHPQQWPEDFDYTGKNITVIGSGATAVTLVPAMAETAKHVTQVQRTPTYIFPRPMQDGLANILKKFLPSQSVHKIIRWKNTRVQRAFYLFCQKFPDRARQFIRRQNAKYLPEGYPIDVHFSPPYDPWDQRLCAVPDADFFKVLSSGKASVQTGHIRTFTPTGIALEDGTHIDADAIILATGLNLKMFGDIDLQVDGKAVSVGDRLVFRGTMLDGVPNFAFSIGYTNSSWTLKVDIISKYICMLVGEMERQGKQVCVPLRPEHDGPTRPLLDFQAGYVQRAISKLPKQGEGFPWEMSANVFKDRRDLKGEPVLHPALRLTNPKSRNETEERACAE